MIHNFESLEQKKGHTVKNVFGTGFLPPILDSLKEAKRLLLEDNAEDHVDKNLASQTLKPTYSELINLGV